ncbi:phospholipase/carboxylesterase family protein-like protein [Sporormia fimetaria CBS 119925]|uniref:Phospholipase/carboxylesterase family protein-like protein n=1 Tax=Sporormia fimetaria CBS 119925 TaxID=1340428 RepID=A0A6A6VMI4_9PLEO|nr:phospholipase/carboxylesterase family protein-like protein [Sporormia fimetaria CBS 119925]
MHFLRVVPESSTEFTSPACAPRSLQIPHSLSHKTTLILLHGRGSSAQKFAEPLLTHPVSPLASTSSRIFRDHFPLTKFLFLTASLRRTFIFKRSFTHQWFDNWSLTEPELKQHIQVQGLRETSAYLHGILQREIELVGEKNVVLMGLSQGCAASLVSTLLWKGEAFGGVVGMCGYLPFRKGMLEEVEGERNHVEDDDEEDNLFGKEEEGPHSGRSDIDRAAEWLREELQADSQADEHGKSAVMLSIPVFMGHGREDEKVPCDIGKMAADFLRGLSVNVEWREYDGLGHWYSEDMLSDVVSFLKGLDGWSSVVDVESQSTNR